MQITLGRKYEDYGPITSIHFGKPCDGRYSWIGLTGMGLGNSNIIYNAHWYDLRHPWERYSRGDTRFVSFWKQLWQGLRAFVDPRRDVIS